MRNEVIECSPRASEVVVMEANEMQLQGCEIAGSAANQSVTMLALIGIEIVA